MREMLYPDRLFDMTKSIAAAIFADVGYPWEVLPEIGAFVVKLGQSLSEEEYERAGKDVWIAGTPSSRPRLPSPARRSSIMARRFATAPSSAARP